MGELGQHYCIALSPDGTRAAVSQGAAFTANGNFDIWVYEFASGTRERLTSDPARDAMPVWSPDGSRVAFSSHRGGVFDLYQKASNGVGNEGVLFKSDEPKHPYDWSQDGHFLIYGSGVAGHFDPWYLPLRGNRKPRPPSDHIQPSKSIPGRPHVAYITKPGNENMCGVHRPGWYFHQRRRSHAGAGMAGTVLHLLRLENDGGRRDHHSGVQKDRRSQNALHGAGSGRRNGHRPVPLRRVPRRPEVPDRRGANG